MPRFLTAAVLTLFILVGCDAPQTQGGRALKPAVNHLLYCRWSGLSPGAGFTRTQLTAWEVDFEARRIRGLVRTAQVPQPMLPYERTEIAALVEECAWKAVPPEDMQNLTAAVQAWLETAPPAMYNEPGSLGHEDGYFEELTVRMGSREHVSGINPRGGFSPADPLNPPPQWRALLANLNALVQSRPTSAVEPLQHPQQAR